MSTLDFDRRKETMKKQYVTPEINMVVLANEDVMTTSAIQLPWLDFNGDGEV